MTSRFKKGALYEIKWRDAVFFHHVEDVDPADFKNGGELLISTGYMLNFNDKSILLVAELKEDRTANRDVNLIPISLIVAAKKLST